MNINAYTYDFYPRRRRQRRIDRPCSTDSLILNAPCAISSIKLFSVLIVSLNVRISGTSDSNKKSRIIVLLIYRERYISIYRLHSITLHGIANNLLIRLTYKSPTGEHFIHLKTYSCLFVGVESWLRWCARLWRQHFDLKLKTDLRQ